MSSFKNWTPNAKSNLNDDAYKSHYFSVQTAEKLIAEQTPCESSPLCRIGDNQYRTILVYTFGVLHVTTMIMADGQYRLFLHKESTVAESPKNMKSIDEIIDKFEVNGPLVTPEDINAREWDIRNTLIKLRVLWASEKEIRKLKKSEARLTETGPKITKQDEYYVLDYSPIREKKRENPSRTINYGALK